MQWTDEQDGIIRHKGNLVVNAVAGSGKTSTLIGYAKHQSASKRILYLAFNKTVKVEASQRFSQAGLSNVRIETAHSLAFDSIVKRSSYKLKGNGYEPMEVVETLHMQQQFGDLNSLILASHVIHFTAYFCNSRAARVNELNYRDVLSSGEAIPVVEKYYSEIEQYTRLLLAKMNRGDIEITHDFYLKKFQLSRPILPYDIILFDEGQDASEAMLDVFLSQKAVKIIVGDTHQQIYGWRYAVNSLEKVDFPKKQLSQSFRFGDEIAQLGTDILDWKNRLEEMDPVAIVGKGGGQSFKSKATLARTNLGLLLQAIHQIEHNRTLQSIHFEGNIQSYTYADDGTSLYDVLNLVQGKRDLIRKPLLRKMKSISDLEKYIQQTDDKQMGMMLEMVNQYGSRLPDIISMLKAMHIDTSQKHEADMVFSTVHRAKGMEYDTVYLVDDFIGEDKIASLSSLQTSRRDIQLLKEEVNLLYVAVTRARFCLYIPKNLIPEGYFPSGNVVREWIQVHNNNSGNKRVTPSQVVTKTEKIVSNSAASPSSKKRSLMAK
jgi:F-box protein 18 (helicase)